MLTLTRKVGDSVYIGKDVMVVIKEIKGKQVRIGVNAPLEYPVYRGEIFERIMEENRASSMAPNSVDDITALFKKNLTKED